MRGLPQRAALALRHGAEPAAPSTPDPRAQAQAAAALLGVPLSASEGVIRAGLRWKLVAARLHPDHSGDGAEARKLIAARDLLLARLRRGA